MRPLKCMSCAALPSPLILWSGSRKNTNMSLKGCGNSQDITGCPLDVALQPCISAPWHGSQPRRTSDPLVFRFPNPAYFDTWPPFRGSMSTRLRPSKTLTSSRSRYHSGLEKPPLVDVFLTLFAPQLSRNRLTN